MLDGKRNWTDPERDLYDLSFHNKPEGQKSPRKSPKNQMLNISNKIESKFNCATREKMI